MVRLEYSDFFGWYLSSTLLKHLADVVLRRLWVEVTSGCSFVVSKETKVESGVDDGVKYGVVIFTSVSLMLELEVADDVVVVSKVVVVDGVLIKDEGRNVELFNENKESPDLLLATLLPRYESLRFD